MIDFNLQEGEPTINRNADYLKQQIDILFSTSPGDVLGDTTYGTDYEYCLHELNLSAAALKEQILNDIYEMDLLGYEPYVNVYLMQGTERDIALIQVDLVSKTDRINQTYKIT